MFKRTAGVSCSLKESIDRLEIIVCGKMFHCTIVCGKNDIEIKTKTVNIIHFPYLDLSQNVKIRDVPYSLKSPRNSECKLAHIYGMNKGKVFMSCVL